MPKDSGVNVVNRSALGRNQACLNCRKRKLKCDAARPHCGTCVKHWEVLISVPPPLGYLHPTEPCCTYDPVQGLPLISEEVSLEKIKDLEEQIVQLKQQLYGEDSTLIAGPSSLRAMGDYPNITDQDPPTSLLSPTSKDPSEIAISYGSPVLLTEFEASGDTGHVQFTGWGSDLPDPKTLDKHINVFFADDPCGSRVLHRPSFLASMRLPPHHPSFPHPAILHAICASSSRWCREILEDPPEPDRFAQFHAAKVRKYIDKAMRTGQHIYSIMQACTILSWYLYAEGRWVETWIFASSQLRIAVPFGFNCANTSTTRNHKFSKFDYDSYPYPRNQHDLEQRRRVWWMCAIFDRMVSVGAWVHAVDESLIMTELPIRCVDFESDRYTSDNPQNLSAPDFYIHHDPRYTDPFILLIKAIMLFGKVTDFNVRRNLKAPTGPNKTQNPFYLPGFQELDQLVFYDFLENLPMSYKKIPGLAGLLGSPSLNTDLYLVHVVPHAATITLHMLYADFTDPQNVSATRCISAARSILAAYYSLIATSWDISRLHPFMAICWHLSAVVHIQVCKAVILIGDPEKEMKLRDEINDLRIALLTYGKRFPIGLQQEKLLDLLIRELD